MSLELACFISPHGFGHATRTVALLQGLRNQFPDLQAHLFTMAPQSLFENSGIPYSYHQLVTDVGLVQNDAFREDREQTIEKLAELIPFNDSLINHCAYLCRSCRLILCDISCLGIEVGQAVSIPSILIENFTWDWIYEQVAAGDNGKTGFEPFIDLFSYYYRRADYRIQTEPICNPVPCDFSCAPMARQQILDRNRMRDKLAVGAKKTILISMGGVALDLPFLDRLKDYDEYLFIVAGQKEECRLADNVRLLDSVNSLHHPDLINGCDLLICKSGYSTIAECLQTRTPICCVARQGFGESPVLEAYVTSEMNGTIVDKDSFIAGDWLEKLPRMLANKRNPAPVNGADQAAEFIRSLL